jgi:selenide,water dikinase
VTGFGLIGHATEMARGSGCRLVIQAGQLPALDGSLGLAAAGVETGGAAHNRRFAAPTLTIHEGVDRAHEVLAFDPQTSGGLLASVPNDRVATVVAGFGAAGVSWWRVGRVESGEPGVELVA